MPKNLYHFRTASVKRPPLVWVGKLHQEFRREQSESTTAPVPGVGVNTLQDLRGSMTLHDFDYADQDLLPSFHSPSSLSEWCDFASAQAMQPDPAALRHQMPRVSYDSTVMHTVGASRQQYSAPDYLRNVSSSGLYYPGALSGHFNRIMQPPYQTMHQQYPSTEADRPGAHLTFTPLKTLGAKQRPETTLERNKRILNHVFNKYPPKIYHYDFSQPDPDEQATPRPQEASGIAPPQPIVGVVKKLTECISSLSQSLEEGSDQIRQLKQQETMKAVDNAMPLTGSESFDSVLSNYDKIVSFILVKQLASRQTTPNCY